MSDEENTWVVFTTLGMAALVFGLLFFEGSAWYVQYPVLAAAVVLSALGVRQAAADGSAT